MEALEFPVLYRDETALALAKPSGWLVHNSSYAGPRERTVVTAVREALGASWSPVHRLDRATSGVLVFASGAEALRLWQSALARDDTEKCYLALVRGRVREVLDVDHALDDEDGVRREARSRIEPVWSRPDPRCSLVRVRVFTGRTHQVRRHCAWVSHHIVGDTTYGKGAINREYRERFGLARLALHAERIALAHPISGQRVEVVAPVSEDLAGLLERIFAMPDG